MIGSISLETGKGMNLHMVREMPCLQYTALARNEKLSLEGYTNALPVHVDHPRMQAQD